MVFFTIRPLYPVGKLSIANRIGAWEGWSEQKNGRNACRLGCDVASLSDLSLTFRKDLVPSKRQKPLVQTHRVTSLKTLTSKPPIQINHQPDATFFQFIILTFIYSSTCFGRCPAHHQELNDCSGSLWFYLRIVVIAVLCSWSG